MNRVQRLDVWMWICVAAGLLAMRLYPTFAPALNHDSFQYLSAADNALAGRLGYTSLVHFDVERSFGVIPAPMMTFPLGYPLAIAAVSLSGASTQTAALLLSVIATLACIPLLAWLGVQLGLSRAVCSAVIACFVFNGAANEFASAALSEALFMFLVLVGVAAIIGAQSRSNGSGLRLWFAAGVAFGAAYFVRYAGLFFIVGLALLVVRHLMGHSRQMAKGHAVTLGVVSVFVMVGVARNILLVGNWRGRDEMIVNNPLLPALMQTGHAVNALFLGTGTATDAPGGTFVPKAVLSVTLLFGIASLAWARQRQRQRSTIVGRQPKRNMAIDLLLLTATYSACMLYAGIASAISYGTARNFVPLLPLILLLFGMLLSLLLPSVEPRAAGRRLPLIALAISFSCYAYLNLLVIHKPLFDQTAIVNEQLDSTSDRSVSSRAAILSHVGPQNVILANNGQAIGHVLGRPTISMVGPTFSSVDWDEETVRATVQRFHVSAVIIFAPIPGRPEDDDIPSPFVQQLAQGIAPEWLKLEHRSGYLLTYLPVSDKR